MKKILLSLLLVGSMLTSCDMNLEPEGQINLGDGITKMADVTAQRNGLYAFLRTRSGGAYTGISDLQTDLFIGTMQNGNAYLSFTTGNILSNDGDIEDIWAGLLSGIMQVNYFIENVGAFGETPGLSADNKADIDRYMAEAYFMRAYYNYQLLNYYCGNYDVSTANNPATGIPLCLKYQPSSDRSTYPGRSSLADSYAQIEKDLNLALTGLEAFETTDMSCLVPGGGGYLNSYAVKALQARVALLKGDYATAENISKGIVTSNEFPLTQINDYESMWVNDSGDELIFQPYGDRTQLSSVPATGSIYNNVQPVSVKFVPAADVIKAYSDDDIRLSAFVLDKTVTYSGVEILTPSFNKYPGNPTFDTGNTSAQKNLPKPFRTSEQYLILAEAAQALGHTDIANDALNTLRAARIENYEPQTYSGNVLRDQIRIERAKELIGEGFRLSDLRRWKVGFTRDGAYNSSDYPDMATFIINIALQVNYTPDSYKYVWPIPSAEIQTNPQLAGQQNPGY